MKYDLGYIIALDEDTEEVIRGTGEYKITIEFTDDDIQDIIGDDVFNLLNVDQIEEMVLACAASLCEYLETDEMKFHAQSVMEEAGLEL